MVIYMALLLPVCLGIYIKKLWGAYKDQSAG